MGFDQERTVHHFLLYEDGGAIDVAVREASDHGNLHAVRQHLQEIAGIVLEIDRDERPLLVSENAFERAFCRAFERRVHLLNRCKRSASNTQSVRDALSSGTLTAMPVSLPSNSG